MRRALLVVMGLASVAAVVRAQPASNSWRLGVELGAPARLLDNGSNRISLGIAEGIEAERTLAVRGPTRATLVLRVSTAPVNGHGNSNDWNPGQAVIADLSLRAERWTQSLEWFAGAGAAHWSGPSAVSPFAGASAALLEAEVGAALRHGAGAWRLSATLNLTKFGPDDDRAMTSGAVLRFLLGVQRDY